MKGKVRSRAPTPLPGKRANAPCYEGLRAGLTAERLTAPQLQMQESNQYLYKKYCIRDGVQ
jgi:hypothetical protein